MQKIKIGFIGIGNRGALYYDFAKRANDLCEVVSIVDFKLQQQMNTIGNPNIKYLYTNTDEFFKAKVDLDLLIISSMDKYHYNDAKRAIALGYNLLLEKPIACHYEEVLELQKMAREKKVKVMVCHVLRYTKFYKEIKRIIDEGQLGNIVNINATENVAYWHQCHSYVRGNWHNVSETAPQILTKCSHDFDIIWWLMNKKVVKVSSFGDLYWFKKANKPTNSTNQCYDCPLGYQCDFNAYRFYLKERGWLIPFMGKDTSDEAIDKFLKETQFGHCVYDMDNDTVDHQVVNILFEDNTTASFTLNAFSKECYRDIKIYGTKADLVADFEKQMIKVNLYGADSYEIDIKALTDDFSGHGGGDAQMFKEVCDFLINDIKTDSLTLLDDSAISHEIAFMAEASRLEGGIPKDIKGLE